MTDRRTGTTRFWEAFWLLIYGERRTGEDRRDPERQSCAHRIVFEGCDGKCTCNCPMKRRMYGPQEDE